MMENWKNLLCLFLWDLWGKMAHYIILSSMLVNV